MSVQVPKGYKQTEVGVIPEDWAIVPFSQVTSLITCGIAATPKYVSENIGFPFLSSTNVKNGKIIWRDFKYIESRLHNQLYKNNPPKKGDILYSRVGTIGEAAVIDVGFQFSIYVSLTLIKPKPCLDSFFLAHLLNSLPYKNRAKDQVYLGGGVGNLNVDVVRKYPILFPKNIEEQQAIAEALSDADALIESLEQLIAKKRQIKQGAMQELLTGQRRLPGFGGEWEKKKLGDLASIQRGASPRPIDSPIWFDEHSNVGWVRISDVSSSSMFLMKTSQCLSDLGIKNSRFVKKSSLIMSICATVGRPIITEIDVCIHDGFVVFDELSIEKEFLYYYLKFIEPGWSKHGQTGSQMNLNTPLINGTEISVPGQNEQKAIADLLFSLDAEIDEIENLLTKSRQIKQSMMQELLTGRIRLI